MARRRDGLAAERRRRERLQQREKEAFARRIVAGLTEIGLAVEPVDLDVEPVEPKPEPEFDDEQWRPVPGFEGFYEVSNRRRVRSVMRAVACGEGERLQQGKLLSSSRRVQLWRGNSSHGFSVGRLVREVWPELVEPEPVELKPEPPPVSELFDDGGPVLEPVVELDEPVPEELELLDGGPVLVDRHAAEAWAALGLFDEGDSDWRNRALCAQTDPEAFFPEKGGSTREAKKICLGCDVKDACLEYALAHDERFGIWGGLSERERRRFKRAVKAYGAAEPDAAPENDGWRPPSPLKPSGARPVPTNSIHDTPVYVRYQAPLSIRYLGRCSGRGSLSVKLRRIGGKPKPMPEPTPEPTQQYTPRGRGTIYESKDRLRRDGYVDRAHWVAEINIRIDGKRVLKRKAARTREDAEKLLAQMREEFHNKAGP